MTTPKQAVAELANLHKTYCPLLDDLMKAALLLPLSPTPRVPWWSSVGLSTDTKDPTILEEQRQAVQIWWLGQIAWGDVAGDQLMMMKADPDELQEIADILQHRRLDDAHRAALIGCCVRSQRLHKYLAKSKSEREPGVMRRAAKLHAKLVAERGGDSAELKKLVAKEIGCRVNTLRAGIRKHGTVPL